MDKTQEKVRSRFEKLDTASICDASPLVRAFAPGLVPVCPQKKMVGRVRPVSCTNDYLTVIKALSSAAAGEVLVVDGHRQNQSVFGEMLAAEASRLGMAGAVIDGAVRDVEGMRRIGLPVYYRWTNPRAGRAEVVEPPADYVSVCGVTAFAGDWIVGDGDGIVIVPSEQAEAVLMVAEEIQRVDEKIFESVKRGASLAEIMKFETFRRDHEREIRQKLDVQLK